MNEYSLSCRNCRHKGLWEMVTSGKPFGYSGDIPCLRCSRFSYTEDNYVPKNSQQTIEAELPATDNSPKATICPECEGTGVIENDDKGYIRRLDCWHCNGTGKL